MRTLVRARVCVSVCVFILLEVFGSMSKNENKQRKKPEQNW